MCFFVQTNHTRKELLFLMFLKINLKSPSYLDKIFYSLTRGRMQGVKGTPGSVKRRLRPTTLFLKQRM